MALGHLRIAAQRAFDDMCEWKAQGDDRYVTSDTAGAYLHRSGVEARMRKNSELQHRRGMGRRARLCVHVLPDFEEPVRPVLVPGLEYL